MYICLYMYMYICMYIHAFDLRTHGLHQTHKKIQSVEYICMPTPPLSLLTPTPSCACTDESVDAPTKPSGVTRADDVSELVWMCVEVMVCVEVI